METDAATPPLDIKTEDERKVRLKNLIAATREEADELSRKWHALSDKCATGTSDLTYIERLEVIRRNILSDISRNSPSRYFLKDRDGGSDSLQLRSTFAIRLSQAITDEIASMYETALATDKQPNERT